ncbi:MAG: PIG-L deacetylase family protein [Ilumatobacteraceae bacterium]
MPGAVGGQFPYRSVLAICAHPDDESFGLGAVLSTFAGLGIETQGLCFTHGEASTLGTTDIELTVIRAAELTAAAAVLGIRSLRLLSYPDGALSEAPLEELSSEVEASAAVDPIDCLLTFDEGGITGHPDHQRATEAALATGDHLGIPVLAWCLPTSIAATLNDEFGTSFIGREPREIDLEIEVDRTLQHEAISCHASQSTNNPVLWRRLTLQGTVDSLRWLTGPRGGSTGSV